MAKNMTVLTLAITLAGSLAATVLARREFTVINYSGDNCTGKPNASLVPLEECLPLPPQKGENWTAAKFGFPHEVPMATVFPLASSNCSSLGKGFAVPCGRCMDSTDPHVGFHRYLCDIERQVARVEIKCDHGCFHCEVHTDIPVGQCTAYDNGTKWFEIGSLNRSLTMPEMLFDSHNATCMWGHQMEVYDLPCGRCLDKTVVNCTITESDPLRINREVAQAAVKSGKRHFSGLHHHVQRGHTAPHP